MTIDEIENEHTYYTVDLLLFLLIIILVPQIQDLHQKQSPLTCELLHNITSFYRQRRPIHCQSPIRKCDKCDPI